MSLLARLPELVAHEDEVVAAWRPAWAEVPESRRALGHPLDRATAEIRHVDAALAIAIADERQFAVFRYVRVRGVAGPDVYEPLSGAIHANDTELARAGLRAGDALEHDVAPPSGEDGQIVASRTRSQLPLAAPSAFMIQMSWSMPATVRAKTIRRRSGRPAAPGPGRCSTSGDGCRSHPRSSSRALPRRAGAVALEHDPAVLAGEARRRWRRDQQGGCNEAKGNVRALLHECLPLSTLCAFARVNARTLIRGSRRAQIKARAW